MQFHGTLQKIQLKSDNVCYGCCPSSDDEVEQRLTILSDGRVWISRYCFGNGIDYKLTQKENFKISSKAVSSIIEAVSDFFSAEHRIDLVTDVGIWDLRLTNTEGQVFSWTGALISDTHVYINKLSDMIWTEVKRKDLFVFDGNRTN